MGFLTPMAGCALKFQCVCWRRELKRLDVDPIQEDSHFSIDFLVVLGVVFGRRLVDLEVVFVEVLVDFLVVLGSSWGSFLVDFWVDPGIDLGQFLGRHGGGQQRCYGDSAIRTLQNS